MDSKKNSSPLDRRRFFMLTSGALLSFLEESPAFAGMGQLPTTQVRKPVVFKGTPVTTNRVLQFQQVARRFPALSRLGKSTAIQRLRPQLARVQPSPTSLQTARLKTAAIQKTALDRLTGLQKNRLLASRGQLKSRLAAINARKQFRAPETILTQWLQVARSTPKGSPETRLILQTPPTTMQIVESQVRKSFAIPPATPLAALGIRLEPLFRAQFTNQMFTLGLRVPRERMGKDVLNFAAALKQKGGFTSVLPEKQQSVVLQSLISKDKEKTAPGDVQWHVKEIKAREAWQVAPRTPQGKRQGEGVIIAHPDSGWRPHAQYDAARIDKNRSANVLDNRLLIGGNSAVHGLPGINGALVAHGTVTASLMVSKDNPELPATVGKPSVTSTEAFTAGKVNLVGVAPKATIVPIKCMKDDALVGVVKLNDIDVARAVEYAIDIGADIISMSLGGVMHPAVQIAIEKAIERNIIVVAAAGQLVFGLSVVLQTLSPEDNVVEPAAFEGVIACAASTSRHRPWDDSFFGENVAITAPGHGVWVADFNDNGSGQEVAYCGEGTSYSTALTASSAALWISYWGRDFLLQQYPNKPLAWVFREVLRRSADNQGGNWDNRRYGPGILNAERLLKLDLPPEDEIPRPPAPSLNNRTYVIGEIVRAIDDAIEFIEEFARDAADSVGDFARATGLFVLKAAKETRQFLEKRYAELVELAKTAVGEARTLVLKALQEVEEALVEVADTIKDAAATVADKAEDVVDAVANGVEKAADRVGEAAKAVGNALEDAWDSVFG